MPEDKPKKRKRIVVEEVAEPDESLQTSDSTVEQEPLQEVKEKVEELQNLTEEIAETAEKSAEVEQEIAEVAKSAVEAVKPTVDDFAPPYQRKEGINPLIVLIPGVLLLGALLGGIYFYQTKVGKSAVAVSGEPTPEVSASPKPTATPQATVDLTKYSVVILNGSGIAGEASKAKSILTNAGFEVGSTGNASNYNFTKTVIKAKKEVEAVFLSKLTDSLSKTYQVAETEELESTSKDEVQVIIGSSKAE